MVGVAVHTVRGFIAGEEHRNGRARIKRSTAMYGVTQAETLYVPGFPLGKLAP